MNGFDVATAAVLAVAVLLGLTAGMVRIALGIVSVASGLVAAVVLAEPAERLLVRYLGSPHVARLAGFVGVFLLVLGVFSAAGWLARRAVRRVGLGWLDRALGVLLSMAVVLAAAAVLALGLQAVSPDARVVRRSRALPRLAALGEGLARTLQVPWREESAQLLEAARVELGLRPRDPARPPRAGASSRETRGGAPEQGR